MDHPYEPPGEMTVEERTLYEAGWLTPLQGATLKNQIAALAADKARLDWLEMQVVNVREGLLYGSRDMLWASPEGDEETPTDQMGPSEIRAQIDARIQKAEPRIGESGS